jgi:DNA-binding transcriptional regulator YiaG
MKKTGIPEIDEILGEAGPEEAPPEPPPAEKPVGNDPPVEMKSPSDSEGEAGNVESIVNTEEVAPESEPAPPKIKTSWRDLEKGDRALLGGKPVHVLQVDGKAAKVFVRQEGSGAPVAVFGSQLTLMGANEEKLHPKEADRAVTVNPPAESKAITKLRKDLSTWNPVNFTQFNSIFGAAVRLKVVFEPAVAQEVGVSVSTVRNWASGTLVPPRNVQELTMGLVRNGLAQYSQMAMERERQRAQAEAIQMTTKGTSVVREGQNAPNPLAETRVNPAVGDLSMELGRSVKVLEVGGETYSCEMWKGEGDHWNAEVKDLGIRASGEHELDVVLDVKGSILRKLEERAQGDQPPVEIAIPEASVPVE